MTHMESFYDKYEHKGKLLISFSKREADQFKGTGLYTWARRAVIKGNLVVGWEIIYAYLPQKPSQNFIPLVTESGSNSADMAYPRKPVSTKEEALEGIRPVDWERLKKGLEPKAKP